MSFSAVLDITVALLLILLIPCLFSRKSQGFFAINLNKPTKVIKIYIPNSTNNRLFLQTYQAPIKSLGYSNKISLRQMNNPIVFHNFLLTSVVNQLQYTFYLVLLTQLPLIVITITTNSSKLLGSRTISSLRF